MSSVEIHSVGSTDKTPGVDKFHKRLVQPINNFTNPLFVYGHEKWPSKVEEAFTSALKLIMKSGTAKIKIMNKNYGRNELISLYISYFTGEVRTKKQISSHIQVLKKSILSRKLSNMQVSPADMDLLRLIENGAEQTDEAVKRFHAVFDKIIEAYSAKNNTYSGLYPSFCQNESNENTVPVSYIDQDAISDNWSNSEPFKPVYANNYCLEDKGIPTQNAASNLNLHNYSQNTQYTHQPARYEGSGQITARHSSSASSFSSLVSLPNPQNSSATSVNTCNTQPQLRPNIVQEQKPQGGIGPYTLTSNDLELRNLLPRVCQNSSIQNVGDQIKLPPVTQHLYDQNCRFPTDSHAFNHMDAPEDPKDKYPIYSYYLHGSYIPPEFMQGYAVTSFYPTNGLPANLNYGYNNGTPLNPIQEQGPHGAKQASPDSKGLCNNYAPIYRGHTLNQPVVLLPSFRYHPSSGQASEQLVQYAQQPPCMTDPQVHIPIVKKEQYFFNRTNEFPRQTSGTVLPGTKNYERIS
ncbi:uncharacterized protein KNAG_0H00990 [Huiozyma naganishii CBS 8797]|uniref:TEA domain-containing protein n=1 Tax=Huiozyma naganishii (strain ATCC MYA-139 / BCRC 22969 / CBS 8797 / KCTC 17520 / NBRC 10181 / NCYC 3082 / Yp74L-3) TaxID=1071383 RepID=J7S8G1_HUIN7|nr:hypothetical protein KNAG_0H00990 [Kazachstania naganishii CBS 8797]CCK71514.1 hypothetical protein KNAG_0H00990 [Kazachstania naganishii CBS 8797]